MHPDDLAAAETIVALGARRERRDVGRPVARQRGAPDRDGDGGRRDGDDRRDGRRRRRGRRDRAGRIRHLRGEGVAGAKAVGDL